MPDSGSLDYTDRLGRWGRDEKLNVSRKADKNLLTEKKKTEGDNQG